VGLALAGDAGVLAFLVLRNRSLPRRVSRRLAPDWGVINTKLQSRSAKLTRKLIRIALLLATGERRGLGFRVVGLRLVDGRTGRPPSRKQMAVRAGTRQLWFALCGRLAPAPNQPIPPARESHEAAVNAARRQHANDRAALQRALMQIYQENKIEPVSASFKPLLTRLPLILAIDLPAFWSPLRQSLPDKLAGTAIVLARPRGRR
jgi:hypothetical protein